MISYMNNNEELLYNNQINNCSFYKFAHLVSVISSTSYSTLISSSYFGIDSY